MRTKNKDKELNHRHFIGLRLTDVELDLLDQGAACLSISRSEYLRKLLLEKQINHRSFSWCFVVNLALFSTTFSFQYIILQFVSKSFFTVTDPFSVKIGIYPAQDGIIFT